VKLKHHDNPTKNKEIKLELDLVLLPTHHWLSYLLALIAMPSSLSSLSLSPVSLVFLFRVVSHHRVWPENVNKDI
jgi:hypothetical protein